MLGGLRLCCGKRVETRFRTQKTGALFAHLALFPARTHSREELAVRFWTEDADDEGRASLRVVLNSLRKQLETPDNAAGSLIIADRVTIGLRREAFVTDVARFEEALAQAARVSRADPQNHAARLAHLTEATTIYTAPLLPGFYDDWVLEERERLHSRFLTALEDAEKLHRRLGQTARADAVALRREQSESSDRVAAGEVEATNTPVAPTATPAHKNIPTDPLPHFFTRFWGRERELAQVGEHLSDSSVSVLTLLGPGGIGKTRLSVEAARAWGGACVWVPVASVVRGEELADALREALNLPQASGIGDDFGTVTAHLRELAASGTLPLLVWDNFEQVEEMSGARFVARLLRAVPQVRLLVSSRRRLGVPGECFVAVGTLPLPDDTQTDPAILLANPAAALFADRARSVTPDFAVTARNAEAVASLTRLLDGLPLAIELAAAWVSVMTPGQMVQKLSAQGQRFALLASRKTADRVERHRSLWNTIGWSYDLLSPDLRTLWRRLSVFHGGFTAPMAETVAGESFTFDGLARLRERSLIRLMAEADGDDPDEPRYELLESLREFGGEQMTEEETLGENRVNHQRFAQSLQQIVGIGESTDAKTSYASVTNRYKRELPNIRKVINAAESGTLSVVIGLELAIGVGRLWKTGYLREGRGFLAALLLRAKTERIEISTGIHGKALFDISRIARLQGDFSAAEDWMEQSLVLIRKSDDMARLSNCLSSLGDIYIMQSKFDQARVHVTEALDIANSVNSPAMQATALHNLGNLSYMEDDYAAMQYFAEQELAVRVEVGEEGGVAQAYANLGIAARECGELALSEKYSQESITLFWNIKDYYSLGTAFMLYGELMIAAKEWERAGTAYGIGIRFNDEQGVQTCANDWEYIRGCQEPARVALGKAIFDTCVQRGQRFAPDATITFLRRESF